MTRKARPLLLLATLGVIGCDVPPVRPEVTSARAEVSTPAARAHVAAAPAAGPVAGANASQDASAAPGAPVETPAPGDERACVDPDTPALAAFRRTGNVDALPIIVQPRRLPSGAPVVGNTLGKGRSVLKDACGTIIGVVR